MRTCEILQTMEDGSQTLVATVTLDGDHLEFSGEANLVASLKVVPAARTSEFETGDRATATSDPVRWFEALPWTYNGMMLRARIK